MVRQHLPEELLELILSKLPVKDLTRFKCVSKSYNACITTKSFFTQHFSHSTFAAKEKPSFLIVHYRTKFSIISDEEYPEQSQNSWSPVAPKSLDPQFPFLNHVLDCYYIVALGPSNGIYCLQVKIQHHPDRLMLWNPATTKTRVLPLPLAVECSINWDSYIVDFGFGFDSKTNDYKVVYILAGQTLDKLENQQPYAQVYSLRTNSWKKIAIDVQVYNIVTSEHSSFLNGVYHWLTETESDNVRESILCFDMSNDAFWNMNVPPDETRVQGNDANDTGEKLVYTSVAIINDLLAYVKEYELYSPGRTFTRVDIWVMNEYGVEESWTKRFIIGPTPGRWFFWGFWKDDHEVLLAGRTGDPSVLYNIDTQCQVKEFPYYLGQKYHAFRYVESIAPLSVEWEDDTPSSSTQAPITIDWLQQPSEAKNDRPKRT